MRISWIIGMATLTLASALACTATRVGAQVRPGEIIWSANADKIQRLTNPGTFMLVKRDMIRMRITPTEHLDWPPPYKAATEQYSSQVSLTSDGELKTYVAGLPFPRVDENDPGAALKIMWNFAFRPASPDDLDARGVDVESHRAGSTDEIEHFSFGHLGLYKYLGRTEVAPTPVDPDLLKTGIATRAGAYPILDPPELRGSGIVRQRSARAAVDDEVWEYSSSARRLRRLSTTALSDSFGVPHGGIGGAAGDNAGVTTYASNWDPDSAYGFAARIQDYSYRLIGERSMLAPVDADSPATKCDNQNGRTICTENWQLRHIYMIEATAKPHSLIGGSVSIPRRILCIDSEGWFVTTSDQYDLGGNLWKTLVVYHAYRDRPEPDATVAIWPFKRMFEVALLDEDLSDGFSTEVYTPGPDHDGDGLYIDAGGIDRDFFTPSRMIQAGH